jgi:uncharacterized protein YndB with AHSA1/START domain
VFRDLVRVKTDVGAPVEVVWRFLTVDRDTWWPEMGFEAVVGSPLVETWLEEGRRASATGSVTDCDEPQLLGFRWIQPSWEHPLDVAISLVAEGPSTSVTLTETGFLRAQTSLSLRDEHEEGWLYHLTRLKRASEGGAVSVDVR